MHNTLVVFWRLGFPLLWPTNRFVILYSAVRFFSLRLYTIDSILYIVIQLNSIDTHIPLTF
jgi:hypothetical protein